MSRIYLGIKHLFVFLFWKRKWSKIPFIDMGKVNVGIKRVFLSCYRNDTWKEMSSCDLLLIRHDCDCGYNYLGKAYAPLTDTFAEELVRRRVSFQILAYPFSFLVGDKSHNTVFSVNRLFLFHVLFDALSRFLSRKLKFERGFNMKGLIRAKKKWSFVLKQSRARIVVAHNMRSSLVAACKENGVLFYELQHGAMGRNHETPLFLKKLSKAGLPLPSGFLCWNEESASHFRALGLQDYDIRVIGNIWLSRFYYADAEDALVQDALKRLDRTQFLKNGKVNILVTLQQGLCQYGLKNGVMTDSLKQVILNKKKEYNWLLRLHPSSLRGAYLKEVMSFISDELGNVEALDWEVTSITALPAILKKVDLHITFLSSTVIEAAYMGVPSAIQCPLTAEGEIWGDWFAYERKMGKAQILPDSSAAIEKWIRENSNQSSFLPEKGRDIEQKYRKNLDNFLDFCNGKSGLPRSSV